MKVLVTGGAGFIGSHVVDKLIREKCEVVVVDNLCTGLVSNLNPAVKLLQMDIRSPQLLDVFVEGQFDHVIHLAAQTMVHKSLEAPLYDCDVNIQGTVNILECCRQTGVKRIVFSSTAAIYGDITDLPVVESAEKRPSSFYGLSKFSCEQYLDMYKQLFGIEYIALRYANVYGERQGDAGEGGVISIYIRKILKNEPLLIFGDGTQTRDFIYVGDIAQANYCALLSDAPNCACNISTQTETSLQDLIHLLENISGKSMEKQYQPPREGDIYKSFLANTAATQKLNWKPQAALADGLARTYCFFSHAAGNN
jgi:UDP-glucose 4-epimerase